MGIVDKAKQAALTATVTKALDYLEKDPETNIPKIMEMVDKVTPDDPSYVSAGCGSTPDILP